MVLALLPVTAAQATPDPKTDKTAERPGSPAAVASAEPHLVPPAERGEVLGHRWRESADVAWTTSGDADGFHLLAARASDGYAWRTVASLSEPGFDVDQWIGNACATGSGRRLVVVYAPRTFTNESDLFDRGGFTATVDLESGEVTKLPVQSSLAYYNPGCGTGESAVVTQEGVDSLGRTRLLELDAAAGKLGTPVEVPGQLTSAIPTAAGIVAADSAGLVSVDAKGARRLLARTSGLPFHLKADADGGVVFLDHEGDTSFVRRLAKPERDAEVTTLARGPLTGLGLARSASGRVFITGEADEVAALPKAVARLDGSKDSVMSTHGELAVTSVLRAGVADPRAAVEDPTAPRPVRVEARSTATGKQVAFTVDPAATAPPAAAAGRERHPELGTGQVGATGSPDNPQDPAEQTCAIARNDPGVQVYQPTARQVEWAVNYAVTNGLHVQRETNWKQSGLPAWRPQQMFPPLALEGGGRVPSQVMLGILAQESNLWQAARFALPGVPANPLIGNFYGTDVYNTNPGDDWDINWAKADCGYGVAQVTDGMRLPGRTRPGEAALPAVQQKAIAVDFATNIAAGLRILQDKWNQTRRAGMVVHDGNPAYLENWFFAVWAYNSGFHPQSPPSDAPWGVGWGNNPVNPRYPANRTPFLDVSYADAANPQRWPYPEKVMGWAGHPIESVESPGKLVHGYVASYWNGWREGIDPPQAGKPSAEANRWGVKPPRTLFCEFMKNGCDVNRSAVPNKPDDPNTPEDESTIGEPAGPCLHRDAQGYYDLKCWWHFPAQWKTNCPVNCGQEIIRFRDPDVGYQPDGRSYPPNCSRNGLPANALVVDDVRTAVAPHSTSVRPCAVQWTSEGEFTMSFGSDSAGRHPSKVDFHQIGAGFGGHFWFSHTNRDDDVGRKLEVTGTWTLNRPLTGWARVLVHTPDHGAHTQQARYEVNRGDGSFVHRYLPQGTEQNKWVSLGVYEFTGTPQVRLSNITEEGRGVNDVAWDAVAFQPLPAKPKHIVAVLGDSYSSGEGAGDYFRESDDNHGTPDWAACRRSRNAWARQLVLPGEQQNLGQSTDQFGTGAELGFVACSGARTDNVRGIDDPPSWSSPREYEDGEGQFREIGQVRSGVLDANTTLVGLTVGGNDEYMFTNAIANCIQFPGCGEDSLDAFVRKYKGIIDRNAQYIGYTLNAIAHQAENAQIVLMGYPALFVEQNECTGQVLGGLHGKALNDLAAHITTRQQEIVAAEAKRGLKVHFAPAVGHFTGHRVCDSPAWLHGVRVGANGEGDFHQGDRPSRLCIPIPAGENPCVSREAFHPNAPGAAGYAQLMQRKLGEIGYQGS